MPMQLTGRELLLLLLRLPLLGLELALQPGLNSSLVLVLLMLIALPAAADLKVASAQVQLSHRNGMEDVGLVMRNPTTMRRRLL
jgi:hypothetical protein